MTAWPLLPITWFVLLAPIPATTSVPPAHCSFPETMGDRLLERKVGSLSLRQVELEAAVARISEASDLPLSFVQLEVPGVIDLNLKEATVREALDALIERAPAYRYGVIGGRLVLYPRDPLWERRIADIALGPGRRLAVTRALSAELAHRVPELAKLSGPWVMGDTRSYTYTDPVSVRGPASILELLLQLPGGRPGTYVILDRRPDWDGPSLSVSSRDQIRGLRIAVPVTAFHGRGETAQLRVVATLHDGKSKDLTAESCATVYAVSDDRVLAVSPDGLVTARANGTSEVTVTNEHASASVTFTVSLPGGGEVPRP